MTSRPRDRDRGDDRGYREPKGGRGGDPPGASRPSRAKLNEFFVNGEGIHREVLQREICKYLGPEAYSRPSSYNGIQGYIVTAVRPFTPKMLDDLQELSDAYISENREITRKGHQGITYGESETSRRQDQILRQQGGMDYDYSTQTPSYTMATTQQGYPAVSTSAYSQNLGGAYQGLSYTSETAYGQGTQYGAPQGTGYGTGYTTGNTRPATSENYTYGNESPRNDVYRQPSAYPSTRGAAAARPPDPRDPRPDPRFAQVDHRGDPRMDPRMMQGGYPSYSTSGDVDPMYDYVSATPPVQPGRGGPSYPSSRVPPGYDHRDVYRNEPIREERRRR